jgi:hypothetical protein
MQHKRRPFNDSLKELERSIAFTDWETFNDAVLKADLGAMRNLVRGWLKNIFESLPASTLQTDAQFVVDHIAQSALDHPWNFGGKVSKKTNSLPMKEKEHQAKEFTEACRSEIEGLLGFIRAC